jgi:hypothetical protein
MQAYQWKTEKFLVSEKKSLVGSTPGKMQMSKIKQNLRVSKCFVEGLQNNFTIFG